MKNLTILFLLASGCAKDLSCGSDPFDWYDDPFYTALHADSNGNFNFEPTEEYIKKRKGRYGYNKGELTFSNVYVEKHPITSHDVEGYGTIYDNGDLDLLLKHTYKDILGAKWAIQERIKREGCSGSITQNSMDVNDPVDAPSGNSAKTNWITKISGDKKVSHRTEREEQGVKDISEKIFKPNVAYEYTRNYADGGYVVAGVKELDGTGFEEWEQKGNILGGDYDYVGTTEFFVNGSRQEDYSAYNKGTQTSVYQISMLWQYDGSGTGTYSQGPNYVCDYEVGVNGSCKLYCPDQTYDCS